MCGIAQKKEAKNSGMGYFFSVACAVTAAAATVGDAVGVTSNFSGAVWFDDALDRICIFSAIGWSRSGGG